MLDGELVVHNAQSGSTHLLEPLAGEVLRTLMEVSGGLSIEELVVRLRSESTASDPADWSVAIEAVLSEFRRLGLAECEQT